jgi:tetratricopeptide (TPR) repeat protein
MKQLLIALFSIASLVGVAQDSNPVFDEANKAYEAGKFVEAIALYHQLEEKQESAELYYNLGNSYYQIDSIAPAILYLEKSIKLKPTEDAAFNLAICNQKITDRIETKKELVITTWWEEFRSLLTTTGWAWLSIMLMILACVAWITYQRSKNDSLVRASFMAGLLSSIATLLMLLMANHVNNTHNQSIEAIIFAANVDVKSSPNATGKTLFVLHQGTKVNLRENNSEWQEIMLADGKIGWILASDLKAI